MTSFEKTVAEMNAAGVTSKVTKLQSQVKRNQKSLFGVRPSINNSNGYKVNTLANANEEATGTIRG